MDPGKDTPKPTILKTDMKVYSRAMLATGKPKKRAQADKYWSKSGGWVSGNKKKKTGDDGGCAQKTLAESGEYPYQYATKVRDCHKRTMDAAEALIVRSKGRICSIALFRCTIALWF